MIEEREDVLLVNLFNLLNMKVSDNDLRCLEVNVEGKGEEEERGEGEDKEEEGKEEGISRETDKIHILSFAPLLCQSRVLCNRDEFNPTIVSENQNCIFGVQKRIFSFLPLFFKLSLQIFF